MSLLENWRGVAYNEKESREKSEKLWKDYFNVEEGIYKEILSDPKKEYKGTVSELAAHFNADLNIFVGFLDGINDSLITPNPIETMDENTEVCLTYDPEKLYYNMVEAHADWLYGLKEWDPILTEERRKELYREQKKSGTVVVGKKIGRNDPCPCGSGKKYKFCCGK